MGSTERFGVLDGDEAWGSKSFCVTVAVTRKLARMNPFLRLTIAWEVALVEAVGRQEAPTVMLRWRSTSMPSINFGRKASGLP